MEGYRMEVEKELCESWRVWIDEKNHIVSFHTTENGLPLEITSREQYLKFIDEYSQNCYRFQ